MKKGILLAVTAVAALAAARALAGPAPALEEKGLAKEEATALAERFILEQGYTEAPASSSKDAVVIEALDASRDPEQVLKQRRGSLKPKTVGARLDSELWFVGFKTTAGDRIRGVLIDPQSRKAKMVSQNLRLEWLNESLQKSTESAKPPAQAPAKAQPAPQAAPEKAGKKGKRRP